MTDVDTLERPAAADTAGQPDRTTLRVDRDALLAAIRSVNAVIEARNTIMILSNFRLIAKGGWLTVVGTDLDTWFEQGLACFGADMDTTVPADRLIGAIDTMRPGMIDVTLDAGTMTIRQGRSSRKLPTIRADDFPMGKPRGETTAFVMPAERLAIMLETARVAQSTEETRYYLCGVFLHVQDGRLFAAATDGHRVMQVQGGLPEKADEMRGVIISSKGVKLIGQLLGDAKPDETITVNVTGSQFIVAYKNATLSAKLVDGSYPDYQRVLPKRGDDNVLTVQSAEFIRCIRAAGAASDGKTRAVRLELSPDHCEASGAASDGGRAVEPIEGDYVGEPLTIGVNFQFAMAVAQAFGTASTLTIAMAGPRDVFLFSSDDRPGVLCGIMPMNA